MNFAASWLISQRILAIYALVMAGVGFYRLLLNYLFVPRLSCLPVDELTTWPSISLVVTARNEERNIETAMRSLLEVDYPALELTIINDRSTDKTGEILARLATENNRLNIVTITDLPAGWLGKNNAMQQGATHSIGEWLLFTDADIHFEPTTLKRAMSYALREKIDHLSLFPDLQMTSVFLRAMIVTFSKMLILYIQPWKVKNPRSKSYMGVGAFNLLRREAYLAFGGHAPIRMRPDDDLKLGQLVKTHNFHSHALSGHGMILVEWYASLSEMIRGLEKNSSAPLEYNGGAIIGSCLILFFAFLWPFIALACTTGTVQMLFGITVVWLIVNNTFMAGQMGQSLWLGLFFPLTSTLFIYIQLRSYVLLLWNQGMQWRDTHYSLHELKQNKM